RRRYLESRDDEGEIQLRSDSVDVLRDLARLRSLLVARTSLAGPALAVIGDVLEEFRASAAEWGLAHNAGLVATLVFQVQADRFSITLHDESGWLAHNPVSPERRWSKSLV